MINNVWTVLCRDIITDQESNSVTYVRCIEEGTASALPVKIGPVFLGTLWHKEGHEVETAQFRVIKQQPGGKKEPLLQTKHLTFDKPRHRLHFRINTLELVSYGTYYILLEFNCNQSQDWTQAARIPVLISQVR